MNILVICISMYRVKNVLITQGLSFDDILKHWGLVGMVSDSML